MKLFRFRDIFQLIYFAALAIFVAVPFSGLLISFTEHIKSATDAISSAAIQAIATFAGACLVIYAAKIQARGNYEAAEIQSSAERLRERQQHLRSMIGYYRLKNIKFSAMSRKLSRLNMYLKELSKNKKILFEGVKKLHSVDIDVFDFSHDDLIFLGSIPQSAADVLSILGKKYVLADTALYNFRLYDFPELFTGMKDEDFVEYDQKLPPDTNGNTCIALATKCQKELESFRDAVGKCWSAMIVARKECYSELQRLI